MWEIELSSATYRTASSFCHTRTLSFWIGFRGDESPKIAIELCLSVYVDCCPLLPVVLVIIAIPRNPKIAHTNHHFSFCPLLLFLLPLMCYPVFLSKSPALQQQRRKMDFSPRCSLYYVCERIIILLLHYSAMLLSRLCEFPFSSAAFLPLFQTRPNSPLWWCVSGWISRATAWRTEVSPQLWHGFVLIILHRVAFMPSKGVDKERTSKLIIAFQRCVYYTGFCRFGKFKCCYDDADNSLSLYSSRRV